MKHAFKERTNTHDGLRAQVKDRDILIMAITKERDAARHALKLVVDWKDDLGIKGDGRLDDATVRQWRDVVVPAIEKAGVNS